MRWTYLLPRLILVALIWSFVAFGMDPLLRYGSARTLESITGAKADIGNVTTTFFPPSVTISNVALARAGGDGKNIVQFDRMHLKLEPDSLSNRRFVVESGRIDGLRFDTRRDDDGRLDEVPEEPEPTDDEPSWMTEQLTDFGTEWLDGLKSQLEAQLDPNVLETYRLGREMYGKWDARFEVLVDEAKGFEPRAKALKVQFEKAREGETLEQIEQYLLVAQHAELLVADAQAFKNQLTGIVPDVRADFAELNAARKRDQESVQHKLSLLKPDPRRISQALLGRTMHAQLQQAISWVQAVQAYRQELQQQTRPQRSVGRTIEFATASPAPDFLLKQLALSGEFSLNEELIPFQAELADVTEDPKLLGRPCVLRLRGDGSRPLQLRATWDATGERLIAELEASLRDTNPLPLRAGDADKVQISGTLTNLQWTGSVRMTEGRLNGTMQLSSLVGGLRFRGDADLRPEISEAANDALSTIQQLNATASLEGTLLRPNISLQSDVGEQIADGLQLAFSRQLDRAQERLIAEVNTFASDQVQKLKDRFAERYDRLIADNAKLLEQANEVRTLVASLQSGNVDPQTLFRQAAQSKLVPEKDRAKVQKAMGDVDKVLNGAALPNELFKRRK